MIKRTSIKAISGALVLLIVGVFAMRAADWYDANPNSIRFGIDMGRPWNVFDPIWISAFFLSGTLFVVSLMFLSKDD